MSTLKITFSTQALDLDPLNRGRIRIVFNNGTDQNLDLELTTGTATTRKFKEVTWVSGQETVLNNQQAINFAQAFNRDYSNVGTLEQKNLIARVSENEVTITALNGTFASGSNYNGNVLIVGGFTVENSVQISTPVLSVVKSETVGNCNTIQYSLSASNGTPPFVLSNGTQIIDNDWDGSLLNINLNRESTNLIKVLDSNNIEVERTINVPKSPVASEFKERLNQRLASSDIIIDSVNPIPSIEPMEYAIGDASGNNIGTYQTSNIFPGIVPETYTLFIRDKYGCEVSKTIIVRDYEDSNQEQFRYLKASAFNSIGYAESINFTENQKKNSLNTTSPIENYPLNHVISHKFTESDKPITQFKSSYPFHIITINHCDGTKTDQRFSMIQENLGSTEKVDCLIFPLDDGIGVYFNGGNKYEPFTTTVIDNSDYVSTLPDWGQNIGQLVEFETLGLKEITGTGYDNDLKRSYFIVDGIITNEINETAQARFNAQIYNLFQFTTDMRDISELAYITIEAGYSFEQIEQTLFSEWIQRTIDNDNLLLIEWEGFKNLGDIVFTGSGFKGLMRIEGRIDEIPTGETETLQGEGDNVFPLIQDAGTSLIVTIPRMTKKLWDTFNKATTLSKAGVFKINNMELVRIKAIDYEKAGLTNYKNITAEFAFGGESTALKQDEIVLNISTGVTGKGGTGLEQVPAFVWDEKERLAINGIMVRIGGNLIVV